MPTAVMPARFQYPGQSVEVGLSIHDNGIAGEIALDFVDQTVEYRLAFVDQDDTVAQRFHLVHLMGRHNNGLPGCLLFGQHLLDQPGVDRVKGGEGFIDDDQVRVV